MPIVEPMHWRRLLLLALTLWPHLSVDAFNYNQPRFTTHGYHLLPQQLAQGRVVGLGDFNSDSFTDLVVQNGSRTLLIYLWQHSAFKFADEPATSIELPEEMMQSVRQVIPSDFNYDGVLDLMVAGPDPAAPATSTAQIVLHGHRNVSFSLNDSIRLSDSMPTQPSLVDVSGTMHSELLGMSASNKTATLWKNVYASHPSQGFVEVPLLQAFASTDQVCVLSEPNSNAFVDMDGDCMADLFLTCADGSFQIWINNRLGGFVLSRRGKLPAGLQQISFTDMDSDGAVDAVYATCPSDGKCTLNIAYNRQMPVCDSLVSSSACRGKQLCAADPNFQLDFEYADNVHIPMPSLADASDIRLELVLGDENGPVPLSLGDANLDGYPDVLMVVAPGGDRSKAFPVLMLNAPCDGSEACGGVSTGGRRGLRIDYGGTTTLMAETQVSRAVFFDMDQKGSLDILVMRSDGTLRWFFNNFFNDAFFLKVIVTNGVCSKVCEATRTESAFKPFGTSYSGATFRYAILDPYGNKRAAVGVQLPRTNYLSLIPPYSLVGLGRTNNYIEELFVGVPRKQDKMWRSWSGIIPNSQLVVHPYQPDGVHDPSTWSLELFINPAAYALWVLLALVCSAAFLLGVVGFLKWLEIREDELEKRKALHIINFDAL